MANYIVKLLKFDCIDESGIDRLGSDEVVWVFTANDTTDGSVNTTNSRKFGNVDSGNSFAFKAGENESVVWPKKNQMAGAPGPIALSIQLWEIDQGTIEDIVKKTSDILNFAAAVPGPGAWIAGVSPLIRDKLNSAVANDLMGSKSLLFSDARLKKSIPEVGDRLVQKHHFGGNSGDLPFEVAGGPDYNLHFSIIRVS